MKKFMLAALIFICSVNSGNATILTFEDIGVQNSYVPVYDTFVEQGFKFGPSGTTVVDISGSAPWGFTGPAHSGSFAVLNNHYNDIDITKLDNGSFSAQNIFIRSWGASSQRSLYIYGLLDGIKTFETGFTLLNSWQDVALNFDNIDTLSIKSYGVALLLDDLQIDHSAPAVPEPGTVMLLGAGFLGLALYSKRRKSA